MIDAVRIKFVPFPGQTEIGRIEVVAEPVNIYEAIRGGYYIMSPTPSGAITDPLNTTLAQAGLEIPDKGMNPSEVPLLAWMCGATQNEVSHAQQVAGHDHTYFGSCMGSTLEHYNTIQFLRALPLSVPEVTSCLTDVDLCAITNRASYDDIVRLALQRVQKKWSNEFIHDLIRSIARGTGDGGGFCRWDEVRTVIYTMKPELKGRLKGWDDFNNMDLSKVFQPSDFDEKDDIIVSVALRESILAFDAFRETFCVPGLYDDKLCFLGWNYLFPPSSEPVNNWTVMLHPGGPWWDLDFSGPKARMQPQKGMTVQQLRAAMEKTSLPPVEHLPYEMKWEELDKAFHLLVPQKVESGLQLTCNSDLPPMLYLDQLRPIGEIPKATLTHSLQGMGIKLKDKDDPIEKFGEVLASLYPSFEQQMLDGIKDKPLIRVNPAGIRGTYMTSMKDHVVQGSTHPFVVDYLLAFFLCIHTRGKSILDAGYTSKLYNMKGVFSDLLRSGYPPPEASFASGRRRDRQGNIEAPKFLAFSCPFGLPDPVDWNQVQPGDPTAIAAAIPSTQQSGELGLEEIEGLLDDL